LGIGVVRISEAPSQSRVDACAFRVLRASCLSPSGCVLPVCLGEAERRESGSMCCVTCEICVFRSDSACRRPAVRGRCGCRCRCGGRAGSARDSTRKKLSDTRSPRDGRIRIRSAFAFRTRVDRTSMSCFVRRVEPALPLALGFLPYFLYRLVLI
jgi:hypothetical protein